MADMVWGEEAGACVVWRSTAVGLARMATTALNVRRVRDPERQRFA